jgi:hypothetical protein
LRIIYIKNDTIQNTNIIEPHAPLLNKAIVGSNLYKLISYRYFNNMLDRNYLYFSRVDTYNDDIRDSDVPDQDEEIHKAIVFEKTPNYTVYDYYNNCRSRTYACCFSIENSSYIWKYGDICIVFNSSNLINYLNNNYKISRLQYKDKYLQNFFYINYGLVEYGSLKNDILANPWLPNPIMYAYFKDVKYSHEKEFRISLSCLGLGKIMFEGSEFIFPKSIELDFDFNTAVRLGIINEILVSPNIKKNLFNKIATLLIHHGLEIRLNKECA